MRNQREDSNNLTTLLLFVLFVICSAANSQKADRTAVLDEFRFEVAIEHQSQKAAVVNIVPVKLPVQASFTLPDHVQFSGASNSQMLGVANALTVQEFQILQENLTTVLPTLRSEIQFHRSREELDEIPILS